MKSDTCSRRDFLKSGAIAAGAYVALPAFADDDNANLPGVPVSNTYPATSAQLTIADPARFKPEPVVELWDLISKQDWEVCQRAQTGVGSRAFTTGVYPRQDRFLYSFNEDYRVRMGREPLG